MFIAPKHAIATLSLLSSLALVWGCATNVQSDFKSNEKFDPAFLNRNMVQFEKDAQTNPSAMKKKIDQSHSRGTKLKSISALGLDNEIIEMTLLTPTSIYLQELEQNQKGKHISLEKQVKEFDLRVKSNFDDRTCFQIQTSQVGGTTYNYGSGPYTVYSKSRSSFKGEKYRGVVVSGEGQSTHPLYFSRVMNLACTDSKVDLTKSFAILLGHDLDRESSSQGTIAWFMNDGDIKINKDNVGIQLKREGQSYAPAKDVIQLIQKYGSKNPLESSPLFYDTKSDEFKALMNAVSTNQMKFVRQLLPSEKSYTESERFFLSEISLGFAIGLASSKCDTESLRYFISLNPLFGFSFQSANLKDYEYESAIRCPLLTEQIITWSPNPMDVAFLKTRNALVDALNRNSRDLVQINSLFATYNTMHKFFSLDCLAGKTSACVIVEQNKLESGLINRRIQALRAESNKNKIALEIINRILQLQKQEKAKENKKPADFI